jgi:hypothetical protein
MQTDTRLRDSLFILPVTILLCIYHLPWIFRVLPDQSPLCCVITIYYRAEESVYARRSSAAIRKASTSNQCMLLASPEVVVSTTTIGAQPNNPTPGCEDSNSDPAASRFPHLDFRSQIQDRTFGALRARPSLVTLTFQSSSILSGSSPSP